MGVAIVVNDAGNMKGKKYKRRMMDEEEMDEDEMMDDEEHTPRRMVKNSRERIITTLGGKHRFETLEGRQHLVVPMVMLTEGVHNGSNGPILYLEEEGQRTPEAWNHKPVTLYHPTINGQGVSACSPEIVETYRLGMIFNAAWEGKLKAEAWLDVSKTKKVAPEVLAALKKGEVLELSTGLFTDNEEKSGEWNGEEYTAIARNWRPDHLAVLPDVKGACSIEDGAGFNRNTEKQETALQRNEASFSSISQLLHKALKEEYGRETYCYVEDIFKTYFIYSESGVMYQQRYTSTDTKASLVGNPSEVVRVVSYRTPEGSVVGNSIQQEKIDMKKSVFVAALIANSGGIFTDEDKASLMGKEIEVLKKIASRFARNEDEDEEMDEEIPETEAPAQNQQGGVVIHVGGKPKKQPAPVVNAEPTVEQFIASAPKALRGMLANGLRAHQAKHKSLAEKILANARNKFTKEQLAEKDVDELEALASLLGPTENTTSEGEISYEALAEALTANATKDKQPGLPLPQMNWGTSPLAKKA